jgi:ribokinase
MDVVVVGQIARDLALLVHEVPAVGGSTAVRARREMLGGKGANQAVAMAQLGLAPRLVGVVGADEPGAAVVAQARRDGVDTSDVVRRGGTRTGLIVDVCDADGRWRYLEDLPPEVVVDPADVDRAADRIGAADVLVLQLQQPHAAVMRAAGHARGLVVLDGAPSGPQERAELLACAAVVRADRQEAQLWGDRAVRGADDALAVAAGMLAAGPRLVVLGAGEEGNVAVWPGGEAVLPLLDAPVLDPTGAGDAFVAGLVAGLDRGPCEAARYGSAAAALTIGHLGGRPDLSRDTLHRQAFGTAARGRPTSSQRRAGTDPR